MTEWHFEAGEVYKREDASASELLILHEESYNGVERKCWYIYLSYRANPKAIGKCGMWLYSPSTAGRYWTKKE